MGPADLKRRRKELGLTQLRLAALLGVDPITVSRWERGVQPISTAVALVLQHLKPKKGGKNRKT